MGRSQRLRINDVHEIHHVVREACELGGDPIAWREHVMQRMECLIGAVSAMSYVGGLTSDPSNIGIMLFVERNVDPFFLKYVGTRDLSPDPCTQWIMPRLRRGFNADRRQICEDRTLYTSPHFNEIMRPCNLDQYIISIVPMPRFGCFSGLSFIRGLSNEPFNNRHLKMLALLHQELANLWRQPAVKAEKDVLAALSPQLCKVLDALQNGLSEKQVALRLGLSRSTIHNHIVRLYRNLSVNTRSELLLKYRRERTFRPAFLPSDR